MKLQSSDGSRLEIIFVGYESPEEESSNWLLAVIRAYSVATKEHGDKLEGFALVREAEFLADWLAGIAENEPIFDTQGHIVDHIFFAEPIVFFDPITRADDCIHLPVRLYFTSDEWAAKAYPARTFYIKLELILRAQDVKQAADDLRKEIAPFPQRS